MKVEKVYTGSPQTLIREQIRVPLGRLLQSPPRLEPLQGNIIRTLNKKGQPSPRSSDLSSDVVPVAASL